MKQLVSRSGKGGPGEFSCVVGELESVLGKLARLFGDATGSVVLVLDLD